MSTILNKEMIFSNELFRRQCSPLVPCCFNENNRCLSKIFLCYSNKEISKTNELGKNNLGVCLLKFEDEKEICSRIIIKNILD